MLLPASIPTAASGKQGNTTESSTFAVTQTHPMFQVSTCTSAALALRHLLFKSNLRRETERTKPQILHDSHKRFHGGGCQLLGNVLDKVKEDAAETNTVSVAPLDLNSKRTILPSVSAYLQ